MEKQNEKTPKKPTKEEYSWYNQSGFDDQPSGWQDEGGEEEYYKALKEWEIAMDKLKATSQP